ncbi:MAG TPA: bifunctional riboflavin kinase/FAD synthetase [Paludibacteraceae bacterium]|nr:bifunctional riboflavin kinase/FAD synthetase [Paludibacteraceae bacterium]HOL00938.1 bifunctional riboflavin kinase/FAD synthetase [Paludibacteraceae bacterium]HPO67833.1 bifunctional riboflavin kinase/FAD synthetase [Paludibacteraceae bacterium]HRR62982.1 bifunctional riboflavin kinase/FAD synthetase [Paludibacteraceae bacterium]
MQIINSPSPASFPSCVATVGFFDGVHVGHRFLIEKLKNIAYEEQLPSVVITFDTHPRKVLHSDFQPKLLTTFEEKMEQLSTTGVDICAVLNFTREMSELSAYEFLKDILRDLFHVQTLLVGYDHRFGHNRAEGFEEYQKYGEELGIKVMRAERYSTPELVHVSSSIIRKALERGDIDLANRLLTYPYSFSGKVKNGFKVGRTLGFPTANLEPLDCDKLLPAVGVYAVRVKYDEMFYKGMMDIGFRPTFGDSHQLFIEVHIIDFDKNIYQEILKIEFIQRLRDEIKFNNVEELIEQMEKDKAKVLALNF